MFRCHGFLPDTRELQLLETNSTNFYAGDTLIHRIPVENIIDISIGKAYGSLFKYLCLFSSGVERKVKFNMISGY